MHSAQAQLNNPLEQLNSGKVKEVENSFSALQAKFDQGMVTEYDLLDAYKGFYQREDRYSPQLNSWIKSYPNSSAAYLARGVYYRKLGEFKRGTRYVSEVPKVNLDYMEQMFELARQDLETALRLNPKSYLAILHLLNISQFMGDDRAAAKYLTLGNAALPSNFILRARYLIHLTPRWGGSYKRMEKFIDESRLQRVSQEKIDLFKAIELDDQGEVAEEQGQNEQAKAAYIKALMLAKPAGQRFRQDYLSYASRVCTILQPVHPEYCR
jgi:tetratricopeptide (TPR) repeat protein